MSKQNLTNLLDAAVQDKQLMQRLVGVGDCDELKSSASEKGLDIADLSDSEIMAILRIATGASKQEELAEQQLEAVAGGGIFPSRNFMEALGGAQILGISSRQSSHKLTGDDVGA